MYKTERYKFGTLTLEESDRPGLSEIHTGLERYTATAPETELYYRPDTESISEIRTNTDREDYAYCHFKYNAVATETSHTTSDDTADNERLWTIDSRMFYFANGQFALQPGGGMSDHWVPVVLNRITDGAVGTGIRFYHGDTGDENTASPQDRSATDTETPSSQDEPSDLLDITANEIADIAHQQEDTPQQSALPTGGVVTTWSEPDETSAEGDQVERIVERLVPHLESHQ